MPAAIVDTAPLIALALAQREGEIPRDDGYGFWRTYGGIDAAIEAFLLYDELLFDGPSLARNLKALPELQPLAALGRTLEMDEAAEQGVYRATLSTHISHVTRAPSASYTQLFWMHIEEWMAAEVGVRRWYPYIRWQDLEAELSPAAAEVARELRQRLGAHAPTAGAACLLLLRTLYYYQLQQLRPHDIVLHPLKAAYVESEESVANILGLFGDLVRKDFYERKQQWLGQPELAFEVPCLTGAILRRCGAWQDLPAVLQDARAGPAATGFRAALNALVGALRDGDSKRTSALLAGLSAAAEDWARRLASAEPGKRVRITVPILDGGAGAARSFVFMHSSSST